MMLSFKLLVALSGILVVNGQIISDGQCDTNVQPMEDFELEEYLGQWFEISRTPNNFQSGHCTWAEYTFNEETGQVDVYNRIVNENFYSSVRGTARQATPGTGHLIVQFPTENQETTEANYYVLDTVYTLYSLVYSCTNINDQQRAINVWKLSRTNTMNTNTHTYLDVIIDSIQGMSSGDMVTTDHSAIACFRLPEFEKGAPVVLTGQCGTDGAPAMEDFDLSRFIGVWHDIASYSNDFQAGTCNSGRYTLTADGANVVSYHVDNLALNSNTGNVRRAGDDNSGRLIVGYPDESGEIAERDYWIIGTDYENYALAYSCVDVDEERMRVFSWKMSRSRSLSAESSAVIDAIIANIITMNNRYYEVNDQSENGCFYFPETAAGQPVVFPGTCDLNIPVVEEFDLIRYLGLWHDIESYDAAFQGGTCNNAQYTLNDLGTVDVLNTQVVSQRLDSINGVARPASNDNSAKLIVSFDIAGQTVESDYWVLATDYDNYALVYSCRNLDGDLPYREVHSWKLSREKTMESEFNNAINNVIIQVPVLNARYYQQRVQTVDGCFFFPEAQPGLPVVFPGQCNDNVAVVTDFDVERYLGIWHDIESYPSVNQQGSCRNAFYSPTDDDHVDVLNTQVSEGFLDSITGRATLDSTDGTAKLTVFFDIPGSPEPVSSPYWVLATDYDNYALVYSCVNINHDQRAVGSWKLGRTKALTPEHLDAMYEAISAVDVLDEQYYARTDQSDEGCFYLPDLLPGVPVIITGQCDPNIDVIQNFDPARYAGPWYDIESYYDEFQDGTCNDAYYTVLPDGTVEVYNTQVVDQTLASITGTARLATTDGSGKLQVSFPIFGSDEVSTSDYWILDTDYETYSLVYSCRNVDTENRRVWSWKLSRTRALLEDARNKIDAKIDTVQVLTNTFYMTRKHSDDACFYYPEPNGQPAVFRGQCDVNILAVSDFDAERYTGRWFNIESYPSNFQDGSCNTARYTLAEGGIVNVVNTQVNSQELNSIEGVARIASDDNTARLIVSFPIPGSEEYMETDYWVLATNYDDYSLVYTCRNKPEENQREVWSWKLSRTKQLTPEAISVMNEVVDNIQVLDGRYFEQMDQSEEGCFFYPKHVDGQPVVFPGQCDMDIPVVENFDVERYQGLWHEVASYPTRSQPGTCNNARYTLNGGQVNVLNSMVNNQQRRITISGTASQVGEDGKLEFSLNEPGSDEPVTAQYWVLATDYDTYSLVYSCMNINPEEQAVWSWKLSREKEMPPEANEHIDQVIESVPVLDGRYFESTDQTNEACFYLPVLAPGESAVFVGQCDTNIPAQPNFDPVRYQGLWHEIESYPSIFQGGTCNNARYDVNSDGTVAVHNTQVVEQRLDTIDGVARLASDDFSGKLLVQFPVPGSDVPVTSDYWVLSTDYDNYALVYSCVNLDDERRQVWTWKLSRNKQLSEDSHAEINRVIDTINVLNDEYYEPQDQTDVGCFFFPVHKPGQPVVFPGQCDRSLQVVQNFDVERYTGTWYDIESYPQQFQAGATCATAEYTLNDDGTVKVVNNQVMSLRPDTITGVAQLDNDVGEAKLRVSFPIAGSDLTAESPYWVLSTDYDNYALVYSCSNIDADWRSVTSWKLSREPTLSPDGRAAIEVAVETVQVLTNEYFEQRGHTEDDCFNYPYNYGGPVYLYGQCKDHANVPAMEPFNAAGFLGYWYEASRFPNEIQTGQCAQTNFMLGAGGFDVVETIVHEEYQHTQEGFAYISDDGRGVLAISFPGIGGALNPGNNYYILDTDYTTFALVYGCRNVDDYTKQVYSWKLSRSRAGLTPAANERIDEKVTSNIDLFEDYYEKTSQGDAACFHYPEFIYQPERIVLPGPCNDTIVPMAGFEWSRYQGRWFETARYPQEQQVGQCARIEFSEDGSVLNTIVLGDDLNSVVGTSVLENDGRITVTYSDGNGGSRQEIHYVLTTDYSNYALVYSCNNLNNGASRQVTSWKLSRQPTWNAAYDAAIASSIQKTQGLLEGYYESSDQSDEACFYIPEVDEGSDVVFRGQCEEVQGVANFDMQRYLGWWHELQHYPSGFATGDCLSSRYQVVNGQYSSLNTSVNGLEATVTTNNLVLSNAAPGRLTKTLDNGETVDIWVLATDYETYSLLYSCQNIDDEYRKVWSAIHSKNRELTELPEEIAIMENIPTLDPRFFVDVDQSDEACFHYPALVPGEQVILPGQCNEQISVVPNFDVASYTGVWFQVERYSQVSETGTCSASSVALNVNSGEITVTNSQVFDGERVRSTGTAEVAADGSGRVTLTFPVEGAVVEDGEEVPTTTTRLHILGTDYTSYALVYACTNVNQFQRSVGAWKLSREAELSANAQAAINALIQTYPELNQQYFVSAPQDEECPSVGAAFVVKATAILVTLLAALLYLL